MNGKESLDLKRLIDESQCENNTENIRKLKHSVLIRNDIRKMNELKKTNAALYNSNLEEFTAVSQQECAFLFNNYTDIFNKLLKDELDLRIMTKILMILKMIEDEQVDQHEGSVLVGKFLKELYIDSAIKRADNIDKEHEHERAQINNGKELSWKKFKQMNM
jgi:hypothetical protein